MSDILNCMQNDPYFCVMATLQILSWIGFVSVTLGAFYHCLFEGVHHVKTRRVY